MSDNSYSDIDFKDLIKKEYIRCAQDPVYFMKHYCMIQNQIEGELNLIYMNFKKEH